MPPLDPGLCPPPPVRDPPPIRRVSAAPSLVLVAVVLCLAAVGAILGR
jgi:hypothetical protein